MQSSSAPHTQPLFGTVSQQDRLGFYQDQEFRPKAVVDFLKFTNSDVSRIADVSKNSVRFDSLIPREVRDRLEEIANICNLVAGHFGGDAQKTALWFRTKNPVLGDISPRDMIRYGRYEKLRRFVNGAVSDDAGNRKAREREEHTAASAASSRA
jgi:hypothetical protein